MWVYLINDIITFKFCMICIGYFLLSTRFACIWNIGLIEASFKLPGTFIAVYSIITDRKFENQMKRKAVVMVVYLTSKHVNVPTPRSLNI